jgi:hypothetical protein
MSGTMQKLNTGRSVVRALLLLVLSSVSVLAQNEAGQIAGKVTDTTGAAITGAAVTIKSTDTGIVREATTDDEGFYLVTSLQPGIYEVTVNASGFAARTQKVRVSVGASRRLETHLSVTPVTGEETIVEGSGGVEINTQNQQMSDPVSGRQLRELPTLTRDPYDLVTLSGNLTPVNNTATSPPQRDPAYAINGQRPITNNVQLDGGENITNYTTSLGQRIPLDGVQEIQVITNGFQPEYGRFGGGVINVATRQGSNDFHGTLYEFHRNDNLSTNSFENNAFGIPRGHLVANQFGYSIGGRLVRDRLFFFNSAEGNIVRSRENRIALVPTAQLLAASSAATQNFFNAFPLPTPINGRVFTVGDIRTLTGTTATTGAFFGLPATTPALGQVSFNVPTDLGAGAPQDTILTVARLDYTFTDRSLIYGRYVFEDRDFYKGAFSFSPFSGFNAGSRERNHNGLINWTQSLASNWVMNAKGSFNRINLNRTLDAQGITPRLFLNNFARTNVGGFQVALPGDLPFDPGLNALATGPLNLAQASLDLGGPWRNQQFRFGGSYFYTQDNRRVGSFQNGQFILGPNLPTSLDNLVAGQASTFQTAINAQGALPGQTITLPVAQPNFNRSLSAHDFSVYFSHSLRAASRLNVTWGLRYDFFNVPRSRNGQALTNFYLGEGADVFTQIRNGRVLTAGASQTGGPLFKRDWDNISPRIGLALDLTGDGKTSLRGGYGISHDRNLLTTMPGLFQNTANFGLVSLTANTGTTGVIPLTTSNFGPLGGTTGTVTLPPTLLSAAEATLETPRYHFYNASLERELFPNTIAAIQYAGGHGEELYTLYNVNRPGSASLPGAPSDARLNPQFGPILFLTTDGRSNYNALIAEVTNSTWRRIGLQFSARYRYARALDNVSTFLGANLSSFTPGLLTPFNPNNDYGPSDFDVQHRFIGSFNWEVPFDKIGDRFFGGAGTAVARQIFGGWQLTGIISANSGAPFTVFNCAGAATAETPCPRLALTGAIERDGVDDPQPDSIVPNRFIFINPSQTTGGAVTPGNGFGPVPAGTTSRNFFRGPNFWNVDLGVSKRFRLTEDTSIQFRGEFFNAFNQANLFVPNNVDVSSTGYVPAFRAGRRHIQLAVKFIF